MKRTLCLGILMLLLTLTNNAIAQECDPEILKEATDNAYTQYTSRDNRCEGFYSIGVEAELSVVSVTLGPVEYTLTEDERIEVSSPIVDTEPVHVRAVGIPIDTYYRLDAMISPGESLTWPVGDVLFKENLTSKDVGAFGWIGEERIEQYVPVQLTTADAENTQNSALRILVRPAIDVRNVKWRGAVAVNGECAPMSDWNDVPKESYKQGVPVVFVFAAFNDPEICMEVTAIEETTGESVAEPLLFHVIVGK